MFTNLKNKFIGDKAFYSSVFFIALPIAMQASLTAIAQLVDNVMVGRLGGDIVAAVGAANQLFFIVMVTFFGIAGGGQIFISQYKGAKDDLGIKSSFHSMLILLFVFSLITYSIVNIFSTQLLSFFTTDPEVLKISKHYLRVTSITYLFFGITTAYSTGYRGIGKSNIPMFVSFTTVITNSILNFLFIFGFDFGFISLEPQGYIGAGYATLIARILESAIIVIVSFIIHSNIRTTFFDLFRLKFLYLKAITKKAFPLTINEFFWSLGQTTLFILYSQQIPENVASFTIAFTFINMFFVLMTSTATAVSIILGNNLGCNEIELAKSNSYKLLGFSFFVSVGSVFFIYASTGLVPILYNVDDTIIHTTKNIMTLMAIFFPIYFLTATCFYILRAGGDIRSVLLMDTTFSWTIIIPICFVLRSVLGVDLLISFGIIQALEFGKLLLGFKFISTNRWAKNLT